MYKWYFRIVDHIYHVSDSWDINGFVVFLLSCFHSDDYNWKTVTDVINTWPTADRGRYRFSKFSNQVVWVWGVGYGNCHEICNLYLFDGLVVWPLWVLFNPTEMHAWCHQIEQWRGFTHQFPWRWALGRLPSSCYQRRWRPSARQEGPHSPTAEES